MLITATQDYALRMCSILAIHDRVVSAREISDAIDVSRAYITQIAQRLRDAGIIEGHPGKHGGYSLSVEPCDLSVLDVMCAVDETKWPERLGCEANCLNDRILGMLGFLMLVDVM